MHLYLQRRFKATGQISFTTHQSAAKVDSRESGGGLKCYFNRMFYRCALARMFWLCKLDLKRLNKTQGNVSNNRQTQKYLCVFTFTRLN